jgi:hypothetical protein
VPTAPTAPTATVTTAATAATAKAPTGLPAVSYSPGERPFPTPGPAGEAPRFTPHDASADEPPAPVEPDSRSDVARTGSRPEGPPSPPAEPETKDVPPPGPLPLEKESPQHPILQALRAYLEDRPHDAVSLLSIYDPKDQEILLRLLPIVAQVEKGGLLTAKASAEEKLTLLDILRALTADLRVQAPLVIEKLVFCDRVEAFGVPNQLRSNVFRPGDKVGIYLEIQNVVDQKTAEERYVCRLASTLEIRNASGSMAWQQPVRSKPNISRSPRNDHFTFISFQMPRDLLPGVYTLRVRLTDLDTNREAEKTLSFRVGTQDATAARP